MLGAPGGTSGCPGGGTWSGPSRSCAASSRVRPASDRTGPHRTPSGRRTPTPRAARSRPLATPRNGYRRSGASARLVLRIRPRVRTPAVWVRVTVAPTRAASRTVPRGPTRAWLLAGSAASAVVVGDLDLSGAAAGEAADLDFRLAIASAGAIRDP